MLIYGWDREKLERIWHQQQHRPRASENEYNYTFSPLGALLREIITSIRRKPKILKYAFCCLSVFSSNIFKTGQWWLWLSWHTGHLRDTWGQQFESNHRQSIIMNIFIVNCWKDKKSKKKEAGNGPLNELLKVSMALQNESLWETTCGPIFAWMLSHKPVWPDLRKSYHLGKNLKVFGHFLMVYLVFWKIFYLRMQFLMLLVL